MEVRHGGHGDVEKQNNDVHHAGSTDIDEMKTKGQLEALIQKVLDKKWKRH